ncbi:MAG: bacillithiol system redox-active protein YtxJ [Acidobacteriota bacterium]
MSFITLDSIEKLNGLFEKSKETPVVLFKHSLTCPISTDASTQMSIVDGDVNLVIVQISRDISNEIEKRTNIRHQSPQVIILKDEKPIYNASHYDVTAEDLSKHL